MSTHQKSAAELEVRLWKEVEQVNFGMLGLVGDAPHQHFQPMTAFCEPENGQIWFYARNDSDLAHAIGSGTEAMFIVQAKDQAFQACIGGRLEVQPDRERINRYWGPVVAAWYPGGRDDPNITLLRLAARDAQVWLSESGPLKFAWEIAKANLSQATPDLGETATLNLGRSGAPSA
jgi:general stress protein 26